MPHARNMMTTITVKEYLSQIYTIPEVTEQKGNVIKTQILGRWKEYFELIILQLLK